MAPLYCSYLNILGKHSTKQNCSKTSVPWPVCPPARRCFFGALVPLDHYSLDLTKPATSWWSGPQATEKEVQQSSAGHPPLHSQPI